MTNFYFVKLDAQTRYLFLQNKNPMRAWFHDIVLYWQLEKLVELSLLWLNPRIALFSWPWSRLCLSARGLSNILRDRGLSNKLGHDQEDLSHWP
ncbi:hypothetical protein XENTR_v10000458 [Xenopus tropicalis]|nr:hypothetical protein XENTR_v10000458 [Xenopus tropicalis]